METREEKLFVLFLIGVIFLSVMAVYYNSIRPDRQLEEYNRTAVGEVKLRKNLVHRKLEDSFIWAVIRQNDALYHRDAVYVGEGSQAALEVRDGRLIHLGENSLIVLESRVEQSNQVPIEVTEIKLFRGNLAVTSTEGEAEAKSRLDVVLNEKMKVNVAANSHIAVRKEDKRISLVSKGRGAAIEVKKKGAGEAAQRIQLPDQAADKAVVVSDLDIEDSEELSEDLKKKTKVSSNVSIDEEKPAGLSKEEVEERRATKLLESLPALDPEQSSPVKSTGKFRFSAQEGTQAPNLKAYELKSLDGGVTAQGSTPVEIQVTEQEPTEEEKIETPPPAEIVKAPQLPNILESPKPFYCVNQPSVHMFEKPGSRSRTVSILSPKACGRVEKITRPRNGRFWAYGSYNRQRGWLYSSKITLRDSLPEVRQPAAVVKPAAPPKPVEVAPPPAKVEPPKKIPRAPDYYNYFQNR